MSDKYASRSLSISSPVRSAVDVTPNDDNDLLTVCRSLYIGSEGDVAVIVAENASSVIFKNASGILPIMVSRVLSTGTTASSILALN